MDPASGGGEMGKGLENRWVGVVHSLGKLLDPFPSGMRNLGGFTEAQGREPVRGGRWENQQLCRKDGNSQWEWRLLGFSQIQEAFPSVWTFLGSLGAAQIHPCEGSGLGWAFPGIQQRR